MHSVGSLIHALHKVSGGLICWSYQYKTLRKLGSQNPQNNGVCGDRQTMSWGLKAAPCSRRKGCALRLWLSPCGPRRDQGGWLCLPTRHLLGPSSRHGGCPWHAGREPEVGNSWPWPWVQGGAGGEQVSGASSGHSCRGCRVPRAWVTAPQALWPLW